MPLYDFKCECGIVQEVEAHMGEAPTEVSCDCGGWGQRVYQMPLFSMNKWNPDYRFVDVSEELDCDKEAIAIGMDE